jgi:hypothetical protein
MKLLCTAIICLITTVTAGYAQVRLGIRGGVNLTTIATDGTLPDEPQMRPALHLGGFGNLAFSDYLSLQAELLYSNKGFHSRSTATGDAYDLRLYYATLPLMLNVHPTERLALELGPEFGLLLAARSRFADESIDVSNIWNKPLDLGLNAGIRYHLSGPLSIGVRYNHGLANVLDVQFTDESGNVTGLPARARNRVLQISLGYTIVQP